MDVSIVSPEASVWDGEADLVIARSPEGEFGIMRGHIPFLAALVPGKVTVVSGDSRDVFFVPGGFLESSGSVEDYHVIVLADDAEPAGDIDASRARELLEEARRKRDERDDDAAEAEFRVAMARVDLAEN
ncbi:MAG: ATP synthase F1 subunit epsilon [Actinomycetota bacterium]|nr:ATP synthase F1 subunit epsilon [Actinomycetota bacterium]